MHALDLESQFWNLILEGKLLGKRMRLERSGSILDCRNNNIIGLSTRYFFKDTDYNGKISLKVRPRRWQRSSNLQSKCKIFFSFFLRFRVEDSMSEVKERHSNGKGNGKFAFLMIEENKKLASQEKLCKNMPRKHFQLSTLDFFFFLSL